MQPPAPTPTQKYLIYNEQVSGKTPKYTDLTDQIIYKVYSSSEHYFYQYINSLPIHCKDSELKKYVPTYLGCTNLDSENIQNQVNTNIVNGHQNRKQWVSHICSRFHQQTQNKKPAYLMLKNLTQGYRMPCIIDIKLGQKLPQSQNSQKYLKYSQSTTQSHHFRINGMKTIHVNHNNEVVRQFFVNKYYFHGTKSNEVQSYLALIFYDGLQIDQKLLGYCVEKLKSIIMAMQVFKAGQFCSSSLLICYDGLQHCKRNMKLIDFDQYRPNSQQLPDENVLQGLKNLLTYFNNIRDQIDRHNHSISNQQFISFTHQYAIPEARILEHYQRHKNRKQGN